MEPRYERRMVGRLPVDLRVHVHRTDGTETILMSHDWSNHGVFLRTLTPLPVATHVTLSSLIGHPAERVSMTGVVVRVAVELNPTSRTPHGMAIHLDELPKKLRSFLEETARRPYLEKLPVPTPATVIPPLLVIAEDHPQRAAISRLLTLDGYDVKVAENAVTAAALLDQGAVPRALVVLEDTGEIIPALKDHLSLTAPPDVAIVLGVPPRELALGLGFPLVILPRTWMPEKLPELLKLFVPSEQITLELALPDKPPPT
jgi:hypothetical protein